MRKEKKRDYVFGYPATSTDPKDDPQRQVLAPQHSDSSEPPVKSRTLEKLADDIESLRFLRKSVSLLSLIGGVSAVTGIFVSCAVGSEDSSAEQISWKTCWDPEGPSSISRILTTPIGAGLFASGIALNYPYYSFLQLSAFERYAAQLRLNDVWTKAVLIGTLCELFGALVASGIAMATSISQHMHDVGFVAWLWGAFIVGFTCLLTWLKKTGTTNSDESNRITSQVQPGFRVLLFRSVFGVCLLVIFVSLKWGIDVLGFGIERDGYMFRLFEFIYLLVHVATASALIIVSWPGEGTPNDDANAVGNNQSRPGFNDDL